MDIEFLIKKDNHEKTKGIDVTNPDGSVVQGSRRDWVSVKVAAAVRIIVEAIVGMSLEAMEVGTAKVLGMGLMAMVEEAVEAVVVLWWEV
ncbi:hypothetical protein Scep_012201 [Stephania cephalantha]|uniref:Uncharacterized protein n=1 Tax=Stephania cephalantha TaxID=152367 RepID=A0AAP0JEQ6_9MAGN